MIANEIIDIKNFTRELFNATMFDDFLLVEVEINTYNAFTINGKIKTAYYGEEDIGVEEYSYWRSIKPICYDLIKGRRLPLSFQIVLKLSEEKRLAFLEDEEASKDLYTAFYINIRYEDKKLLCVSACSLAEFTMDLSVQRAWDEYVKKYLRVKNIDFEEK